MPGHTSPPLARGATEREQAIIDRAFHRAELVAHKDRETVSALREAVELLVEVIEARGERRRFDGHHDRPRDGG